MPFWNYPLSVVVIVVCFCVYVCVFPMNVLISMSVIMIRSGAHDLGKTRIFPFNRFLFVNILFL